MVRRGVVLVVLAILVVGCGGASNDVVTETSRSTQARASDEVDESTSSIPSETMTTSSTAPAPPRPTSCGTTTEPDDVEVAVTITTGWGRCSDALALIDSYYRDRPPATEDPTRPLVIDGWECAGDEQAQPVPLVTCELPGYAVVTAGPES